MSTANHPVDLQIASVLVATDFSSASEKPVHHALAIADSFGAKFYVLNVVSSVGFTLAGPEAVFAAEQAVGEDARRLEEKLFAQGAFARLEHEVLVRQGLVWKELLEVVREKEIGLTVIGTHGRRGMGKLVLGSVAEQIFRHAEGAVLTVGPGSYREPRVETTRPNRRFLFATDFGDASLKALPYAVSFANHFGATLVLYHMVPAVLVPEDFNVYTARDMQRLGEEANAASLKRLRWLVRDFSLKMQPEFEVEDATASPAADQILRFATRINVDLIVVGLHRSTQIGMASHLPWTTAYEVVCGANCPVLTVRPAA
jgi:nucleotide-binding universal stress UspA family protein